MKHVDRLIGVLLLIVLIPLAARGADDPESAVLSLPDFSQHVLLRIPSDGYADASKLLAMHGIDPAMYASNTVEFGTCSKPSNRMFEGSFVGINSPSTAPGYMASGAPFHSWLGSNGLLRA